MVFEEWEFQSYYRCTRTSPYSIEAETQRPL
jgi:hypothetical protein